MLEKEIIKLRETNKLLKKERDMYKKAYYELECYLDSISDEQQIILVKKLERIFKIK
jgi:hypothetical protein